MTCKGEDLSEEERSKLTYFEAFYYQVWGSDWISSDVTYDISRATEELTGFNSKGEDI